MAIQSAEVHCSTALQSFIFNHLASFQQGSVCLFSLLKGMVQSHYIQSAVTEVLYFLLESLDIATTHRVALTSALANGYDLFVAMRSKQKNQTHPGERQIQQLPPKKYLP